MIRLISAIQILLSMCLKRTKLLLFDDNKINMEKKPENKQQENPVGYTGEGKRGVNSYKFKVSVNKNSIKSVEGPKLLVDCGTTTHILHDESNFVLALSQVRI